MNNTYDGRLKQEELPDLRTQPKATCPHCGAIYEARWEFDGPSEGKGRWVLRTAAEDVFGYGDYVGHVVFREKATPEQRRMAGDNTRRTK